MGLHSFMETVGLSWVMIVGHSDFQGRPDSSSLLVLSTDAE